MIASTLIIGCLFLYGKSKYFSEDLSSLKYYFQKNPLVTRVTGYLLLGVSAFLISRHFDLFTTLIIFTTAVYLCLSLMVILLSLNKRYLLFFGAIAAISTFLELIYAS